MRKWKRETDESGVESRKGNSKDEEMMAREQRGNDRLNASA